MFWHVKLVIALCSLSDPCMSLSPPCFTEEDRFSLEALQTIHKQMDDDKDGGIEVEESDEVGGKMFSLLLSYNRMTAFLFLVFNFLFPHVAYCVLQHL